jgi:hypothetical protein
MIVKIIVITVIIMLLLILMVLIIVVIVFINKSMFHVLLSSVLSSFLSFFYHLKI